MRMEPTAPAETESRGERFLRRLRWIFSRSGVLPLAFEHFLAMIPATILVPVLVNNSFGTTVMAAFAVAVKIDSLCYMPIFGFSIAATTLVAQNLGAGDKERAFKQGAWSTWMSVVVMRQNSEPSVVRQVQHSRNEDKGLPVESPLW